MAAELGPSRSSAASSAARPGPCCGRCWSRWTVELRLVETGEASGSYVHDRRSGEREPIAQSASMPPSRHEIDELFSSTVAAALDSDVLALCGPYPGEALPLEIYGNLVADVKANGTPVDRRPLTAPPRQRPRGRAGPGQDQRLGAGRVRRGAGRQRGADARRGAAPARRRRRRRDHHPRRGAGDGPARRRGLGANPAALRARLARGLRRLDDGRRSPPAWPPGSSGRRRCGPALPPAPPTSSATASAAARAAWSKTWRGESSCARSSRVQRFVGPLGGQNVAPGLRRRGRRGAPTRSPSTIAPRRRLRASTRGAAPPTRSRPGTRRPRAYGRGRPPWEEWASLLSTWIRPASASDRMPSAVRSRRKKSAVAWTRAPAATSAGDPLVHVGGEVALGMGDQRAVAALGQVLDPASQAVAQRPRRRLQQDPAARPERHPAQLLLAQTLDRGLRHLAALQHRRPARPPRAGSR